ncbi:hypothetical protein LCGC14_0745400 [marine sediment metagenome]|uniref:Uncharacterized protein n=1 Tax=marine sediment metagenome TaxID=412755 RepID=A0A0F9QQF9_9ZZZZ
MPSLGQQERERAFQEWLTYWSLANSVSDHTESHAFYEGRRVRAAFDAGVEHGLELRNCCHAHPDNGGRLAVKERDES